MVPARSDDSPRDTTPHSPRDTTPPTQGTLRPSHYRMTLHAVGESLTGFASSREFVGAIADAMEGTNFQLHADMILNFLQQPMTMPTSLPAFFTVISVSAIFSSRITRRECWLTGIAVWTRDNVGARRPSRMVRRRLSFYTLRVA
jgi:hypothetical protein